MKKPLYALSIMASSLLLLSCQTTPADRIEENPGIFAALPNWEKDRVIRGEVAEDMSPDAVKLAWGAPNSIESGQSKGVYEQKWVYSTLYPVSRPCFPYGGYRHGWYRPYPYYGYGGYQETDYIPVMTGYVQFRNNKVVSWEKRSD